MTTSTSPFHLTIAVDDIDAARAFYGTVLGLVEKRSRATWIDWDLYGHQFVTHQVPGARPTLNATAVDGDDVPVPHFGVYLDRASFDGAAARLEAAGTVFIKKPWVRHVGEPGEQWTMFFLDPAGNALEFKTHRVGDLPATV